MVSIKICLSRLFRKTTTGKSNEKVSVVKKNFDLKMNFSLDKELVRLAEEKARERERREKEIRANPTPSTTSQSEPVKTEVQVKTTTEKSKSKNDDLLRSTRKHFSLWETPSELGSLLCLDSRRRQRLKTQRVQWMHFHRNFNKWRAPTNRLGNRPDRNGENLAGRTFCLFIGTLKTSMDFAFIFVFFLARKCRHKICSWSV